MKVVNTSIVYDNPLPQRCSRQAMFPYLCELPDGRILASFQMGEAFESADCASHIAISEDGGATWGEPYRMFDENQMAFPFSEGCKFVYIDGRLLALGTYNPRLDPMSPLGNPETGGLLATYTFYAESKDNGATWSSIRDIDIPWGPHTEATAPITVAADGSFVSPITTFPDWDGKLHADIAGYVLRSKDGGRTWTAAEKCMEFPTGAISCYEQRMCRLASGALVVIGWNEDLKTGERYNNHYTYSADNGYTWTKPLDTGILGQASSVCAIGGEKLFALHAIRRDTDRPGVYGYVVDVTDGGWKIEDEAVIWEPAAPMKALKNMAGIFSFVKFGQPGAIKLADGDLLMVHWYCEEGQYKVASNRIRL